MCRMTTEQRPFVLSDPADNQRVWFMDLIHSPRALPPLASDLNAMTSDFTPMGLEPRVVNGYAYSSPRNMGGPPPEMPALPPGGALKNWQTKYLPDVEAKYELFRDAAYARMSAAEILAFVEREFAETARVFGNTIVSAMEIGPEADVLATLLESKLGPEGSLLAATILHGSGSQTRAIGTEVAALAEAARAATGVSQLLTRHEFAAALAHEGEPWAGALRAFLDDHADEIALWSELHVPAWNEDPEPLLRVVAATLASPQRDRTDASAQAIAEARARLDPADHEAFEAAIATSRNYVPVIEHRARWQLKLFGAMRRPFVAIGQKFVDAGRMDAANDVFFLHYNELTPAMEGDYDLRALVAERKAEHEANLRLTPPMTLGLPVPYEMLGAVNPMLKRMFGAVALVPDTETVVNGIGGSKGIVRGRARIVGGLAEAEDLQDGDILVCPSTSPPWSPYFAIVSAIVTDAGGVLSHAAIEAREYGIPAVVGTRTATHAIPDMAMITVDGSAGTVTIER
jgi:pyruvate,water dikinase